MLGGVMAGNDGGVIVAPAAKFPNKENEAFKPATYVLWPKDLPTSQPAPSPAAAPASPATAPARGATPAVPATPARGR